jgi:hypothetical protein
MRTHLRTRQALQPIWLVLIVASATPTALAKPKAGAPTVTSASSAVASASVAAPSTPHPNDDTNIERAAKLRLAGNEAMISLGYADALAAYEQALALTPNDATLLYNIARARQLLGDFPEALTALEQFEARATAEQRARAGKLDALYAQLRPRVATLTLECDVKGARVLVRDHVLGVTPLGPTRLRAGTATMSIELDGYFTETREITLPGGGASTVNVSLHRKSVSGMLTVKTEPLGATITIDGTPSGTATPKIELALAAGPHEVLAHREGYDDARVPLVLTPGGARELSIPMSKSVPITSRWWFWTGVGAVVLGGVALGIALSTEKAPGHGTLAPGQVSGP